MWVVFKKEIRSFLGSFIAYIVMGVFLIITGLFMWIIQEYNVLDLGIASLQVMFYIAPYILIFLVSAITMRSLSEERRLGTIEILTTRPVSDTSILLGKYFAAVGLIVFTLLPTLFYYYTIQQLADPLQGIDNGATWGSYLGLILLAASYASIGLFASSLTDNQIVSLIISMVLCFFWFGVLSLLGDVKALLKDKAIGEDDDRRAAVHAARGPANRAARFGQAPPHRDRVRRQHLVDRVQPPVRSAFSGGSQGD